MAQVAVQCSLSLSNLRILLFCSKHGLYPSVKAGGYGTAGWAIGQCLVKHLPSEVLNSAKGGDIIIDLSKLADLDIELPQENGSFTSLRDMPPQGSKGKSKAGPPIPDYSAPSSGKRRREDDDRLRSYDSASEAVAKFLSGPALPLDDSERPRPTVRRRLNLTSESTRPDSASESTTSPSVVASDDSRDDSSSTIVTSPSLPLCSSKEEPHTGPSISDPFGYLDADPTLPDPTAVDTNANPGSRTLSAATVQSFTSMPQFTQPGLPPQIIRSKDNLSYPPIFPFSSHTMLSHAEPLHTHAYVSFGAGVRQKEVDQFTAANPFEAKSLSEEPSLIPYHVPLCVILRF
jgi:hypothetical protein